MTEGILANLSVDPAPITLPPILVVSLILVLCMYRMASKGICMAYKPEDRAFGLLLRHRIVFVHLSVVMGLFSKESAYMDAMPRGQPRSCGGLCSFSHMALHGKFLARKGSAKAQINEAYRLVYMIRFYSDLAWAEVVKRIDAEASLGTFRPTLDHSHSLDRILRPIRLITKARVKKLLIEVETFLGLQETHPQA
ncbi:hypothetical protein VNO77_41976 [Canavalia gladiata]|uniref:Uncharacterized protein n=1 Tax=Canavalia gladiata TaxID=3824 RepID=A0AAN9PSY6_CANGL